MKYPTDEQLQYAMENEQNEKLVNWYNDLPRATTPEQSKTISTILNYLTVNEIDFSDEDDED